MDKLFFKYEGKKSDEWNLFPNEITQNQRNYNMLETEI